MSEYLKHYKNAGSFTKIASIGDGDLKLTEFGLITLKRGESFSADSGASEVALIVLGGTCSVSGKTFAFKNIGERKDVFSGKPYTVYIPCGSSYTVTAVTNVEVAWTAGEKRPGKVDGPTSRRPRPL